MQKYKYILHGIKEDEFINHPDKYKEMDLFLAGTCFRYDHPQNLVVEIKNPTTIKKLSSNEYFQIQKYMDVISSIDSFNDNREEWTYFLIGQDYDDIVDMNIKDKQSGLAVSQKNYKLYVKKWSQIINDVEKRIHYLEEKIKINKEEFSDYDSVDALLEDALCNSAVMQKTN